MFCYQCEQTTRGQACTDFSVCGKDPITAALQDVLLYQVKGIGMYAHRLRCMEIADPEIDRFVLKAVFSTLTNVNFDPLRLVELIVNTARYRDRARYLYVETATTRNYPVEAVNGPASFIPAKTIVELVNQGIDISIKTTMKRKGVDITGLEELVMYGLKGMVAYLDHASILGHERNELFAFIHEALDFLTTDHSVDKLLAMSLRIGEMNLKTMELLDEAHTSTYGHPEPVQVRISPVKGKAILVSGHDLKELEELLKQTEGKGVNIYTHGELLPAHSYPELRKYSHLVGNYGSAWQNQQIEFELFPGAILMTTNCLQRPVEGYKDRIFTGGCVAWPGVKHIENQDFTPVIEAALAASGFQENGPEKTIMVGFGRNAVMNVADKVIDAVKSGKIRHFFLIGGCDGAKSGRNYYTEFAQSVPQDSVILTLACGKYRFNKLDFGNIDGIPRLLDVGQCNDAYSAIQIAVALANAFGTDVNSLPLSLILSWYEQKAVAILLTLLHLGIRNMRIGPTLPAFISPAALNVLVEKFNLMPVTTVENDLKAILK